MQNIQDFFYKKKESDLYFNRWLNNNNKEYKGIMEKKEIRLEKKKILSFLKKNINLNNKNVLEIGCFVGDLLYYLERDHKCKVHGVESSNKACKLAKKIFGLSIENTIFFNSRFFGNKTKNYEKFDIIICDDVLSWMDRAIILQVISSIDWLLKKNGYIFLRDFTPNRNISVRNHHHKKKIFNYKIKNGHKTFFLESGKYSLINNRKFITERFNKKKMKNNEINKWSDTILKKKKEYNYKIKKI